LNGELLDDIVGALFRRQWFDDLRVDSAPDLQRIVVAIDPAVSTNEGSDLTGNSSNSPARSGSFTYRTLTSASRP
jgi:phage terminase large subunit-like protein